jgi:hypothetical protein
MDLNKTQRWHKNFLEQLTTVCTLVLVCGLELPIVAIVFAILFGIFRFFYFCQNRYLGFIPGSLCLLVLACGALYSSIVLITKVNELPQP